VWRTGDLAQAVSQLLEMDGIKVAGEFANQVNLLGELATLLLSVNYARTGSSLRRYQVEKAESSQPALAG
jgi:hypothetical protein